MRRLARLKQGYEYTWPLSTGYEVYRFGGHCRSENIASVWAGKIEREVKIEASEFHERDTIGGSMKLVPFRMPPNKAILGIITNGELRIVTEPATGEVAKIHHRQPVLVDL